MIGKITGHCNYTSKIYFFKYTKTNQPSVSKVWENRPTAESEPAVLGQPVSCRVRGWALDFLTGSGLVGYSLLQQPTLQPLRDTECVEEASLSWC